MQRLSVQRVGHVMLNIGALMFTAWFLLLFFGGVTYGGGVLLLGGLSLAVIGFTVREMSKLSNIDWGSLLKNMVIPGLFALGFLLVIVAPLSYFLNIPFVEMGSISVNFMFRLRYIILGLGAAVGSVGLAFALIKSFQKSRASFGATGLRLLLYLVIFLLGMTVVALEIY